MRIEQLLSHVHGAHWHSSVQGVCVDALVLDSRLIKKGDVFVALRGTQNNGENHIEQAVQSGATLVIHDAEFSPSELPVDVQNRCVSVPNLRYQLGEISAELNQHPTRRMHVVGVTGTDGKTSTSHFIAQLLSACGEYRGQPLNGNHVGVIGTVGNGVLTDLKSATHTTPDAVRLQTLFAEFEQQGIQSVAMEVSSHALDQGRVDGVAFDVAVLTNLARDHMDYHHSMREYARAKSRLFAFDSLSAVVINGDDDFGCNWVAQCAPEKNVFVYGFDEHLPPVESRLGGKLQAKNLVCSHQGLDFDVTFQNQTAHVRCSLIGRFNAHNVLAAMATVLALGASFDDVVNAVPQLTAVAGRMQKVMCGQNAVSDTSPYVIVDYAHTPQALEAALSATREHMTPDAKLFCVFGCGGDRDSGKRALMGAVATQQADVIVLTDDNPRTELPQAIFDDVLSGIHTYAKKDQIIECIHNRAEAIEYAITNAADGDMVLIAGKGHENYQIIGMEKIDFCDVLSAQTALSVRAQCNQAEVSC